MEEPRIKLRGSFLYYKKGNILMAARGIKTGERHALGG